MKPDEVFGSLTAIRPVESQYKGAYWEFKCTCGKTHVARANTVRYEGVRSSNPRRPSCGCANDAARTKHGLTAQGRSSLYTTWVSMKQRCYNPQSTSYPAYGAKGVTMCKEWRDSPEAFTKWCLDNGWQPGLQVDKDTRSHELGIHPPVYSPATCKMLTPQQNAAFSTSRSTFGHNKKIVISVNQANEILALRDDPNAPIQRKIAAMYGLKSHKTIQTIWKSRGDV